MDMILMYAIVVTSNKQGCRPIDVLKTSRLRLAYGAGVDSFDNITRDKGARESVIRQYEIKGEDRVKGIIDELIRDME